MMLIVTAVLFGSQRGEAGASPQTGLLLGVSARAPAPPRARARGRRAALHRRPAPRAAQGFDTSVAKRGGILFALSFGVLLSCVGLLIFQCAQRRYARHVDWRSH